MLSTHFITKARDANSDVSFTICAGASKSGDKHGISWSRTNVDIVAGLEKNAYGMATCGAPLAGGPLLGAGAGAGAAPDELPVITEARTV